MTSPTSDQAEGAFYGGTVAVVTGATGFIGGALSEALSSLGCRVVRFGRNAPPCRSAAGSGMSPVDRIGDIAKQEDWLSLMESERPDFVFSLAAQTDLHVAATDPNGDFRINVEPIRVLAQACEALGRRPFVASTGTVTQVGAVNTQHGDETLRDRPATLFDLHKLLAETCLLHFADSGVLQGTSLRLANVYGPGRAAGSTRRGAFMRVAQAALNGGPVRIYGTGDYLRDYVYIDDVVRALLRAPMAAERTNGRYFLIGSGIGTTIGDAFSSLAAAAGRRIGATVPVKYVPWPQTPSDLDVRGFVVYPGAFVEATGWRPTVFLNEGIDRSLAFLENSMEPTTGNGDHP